LIRFSVGGRHVFLLVFGVFFVAGSLLTVIGLRELAEARRLRREGRLAEAVVVDKDIRRATRSGNSRTEYSLRYRFEPEGRPPVEGRAVVDVDEWERRQVGDRLTVRYLPGAADVHRRADEKDLEWPLVNLALGVGIGSLFGALLGRQLFRLRRDLRLRRHGVPTEATVLTVEPAGVVVNRVAQWPIRYRYHDHLNKAWDGDSGAVPPDDVEGWKAGDTAKVRFDRERPQDSVWIGRA
jgi:uncharacterized protein DUF3592